MQKMDQLRRAILIVLLGISVCPLKLASLSIDLPALRLPSILSQGQYRVAEQDSKLLIDVVLPFGVKEVKQLTITPSAIQIVLPRNLYCSEIVIGLPKRVSVHREDYPNGEPDCRISDKEFVFGKCLSLVLPLDTKSSATKEKEIGLSRERQEDQRVDHIFDMENIEKSCLRESFGSDFVYYILKISEKTCPNDLSVIICPNLIKVVKGQSNISSVTTKSKLDMESEHVEAFVYKANHLVVRVPKLRYSDEPSLTFKL